MDYFLNKKRGKKKEKRKDPRISHSDRAYSSRPASREEQEQGTDIKSDAKKTQLKHLTRRNGLLRVYSWSCGGISKWIFFCIFNLNPCKTVQFQLKKEKIAMKRKNRKLCDCIQATWTTILIGSYSLSDDLLLLSSTIFLLIEGPMDEMQCNSMHSRPSLPSDINFQKSDRRIEWSSSWVHVHSIRFLFVDLFSNIKIFVFLFLKETKKRRSQRRGKMTL